MNRKDFLKNACGLGACSCLGAGLLNANDANAQQNIKTSWKERFTQHRFSNLISILDENLDETIKYHIIESLGRECAKTGKPIKYENNLQGFFDFMHEKHGDKFTYNKELGVIRVETPEGGCFCPMFDSSNISESICQCSVGWQHQTYETILGQSVKVKCIESVVRGSTKCVFEIFLQNNISTQSI